MTERLVPYSRMRIKARYIAGAALCVTALVGAKPTQTAVANGETRTLTLYHTHTQESLTVTFRRYGSYDTGALQQLNSFLRDWRTNEPTNMDPRLFDVIWETYRETGSQSPVRIVSAYRSPHTNSMLRRRSRGVAKHSQHMLGKAMDFHLPDVSMARVREIGMRLQRGGVGYYPTANSPFVHLDVGTVRSWPRMTRPQLERLFPDGMTVHLPADGQPLANYQAALAMVESRGGSAFSYSDVTSPRRSLWAMLFGGEDSELEDTRPAARGRAGTRVAARRGAPPQVASLSAGDSSSVYVVEAAQAPLPEVIQPDSAQILRSAAPVRGKPKPLDEQPEDGKKPAAVVASLGTPPPLATPPSSYVAVAVPLPPRRPNGLSDAAQQVASNVPSPPQRPADMNDITASIGEPRPYDSRPAARLVAVQVPVPPARPAEFPRNATASASKSTPSSSAAASDASKVVPRQPAKNTAGKLENMMTTVATGSVKGTQPDKVAMPSVRQSVRSSIVASRMGDNVPAASGKLVTGVIAQPLDAGFVKRGD